MKHKWRIMLSRGTRLLHSKQMSKEAHLLHAAQFHLLCPAVWVWNHASSTILTRLGTEWLLPVPNHEEPASWASFFRLPGVYNWTEDVVPDQLEEFYNQVTRIVKKRWEMCIILLWEKCRVLRFPSISRYMLRLHHGKGKLYVQLSYCVNRNCQVFWRTKQLNNPNKAKRKCVHLYNLTQTPKAELKQLSSKRWTPQTELSSSWE